MTTNTRYALLILGSGIAGALSAFFWMIPKGIMAAALGVWLSIGSIWLSRQHLTTRVPPSWLRVLGTGLVTGLMGGATAFCIQWLIPVFRGNGELDFTPRPAAVWTLLLGGALYGLVLHTSCRARVGADLPRGRAVGIALLGCACVRLLLGGDGNHVGPVAMAIFGAMPFATFWVLVNASFDPAWKLRPTTPHPQEQATPETQRT
jgi:hypothetical protein